MKILRLLAILLTATFMSCGDDPEPTPKPDPDPEPEPEAPLPPPIQQPEVSRTVLVYIVANNTLGNGSIGGNVRYDYLDIDEMLKGAKAGYLNGGRLLVYHNDAKGSATMKEVTANGIVELKTYGDESPLAVSTMRGVLDDMRSLAPADEYGLVMWSHSSGWRDPGLDPEEPDDENTDEDSGNDLDAEDGGSDSEARGRSFIGLDVPVHYSWGIDKKDEMSIPALGRALNGQNLMFIYFDCCFMGNIESIYQLRNSADYVIASATEVPLGGMRYDLNLANLFKYDISYKDIADNTYDYYNGFKDMWRSISISVYDMSMIDGIATAAADVFLANAGASVDRDKISSYSASDTFPNNFFDLKQYINSLSADENAADAFNQVFDRFVVYTVHTPYMWWDGVSEINKYVVPLEGTNGLSCYILTGVNDDEGSRYKYKELDWWTDVVSKAF